MCIRDRADAARRDGAGGAPLPRRQQPHARSEHGRHPRHAGGARRHHDGAAPVGRAGRRRSDPDPGAGGGGDRRNRLGARRAHRSADGRGFRYAEPGAHSARDPDQRDLGARRDGGLHPHGGVIHI